LTIYCSGQSGETANKTLDRLRSEMDSPMVVEADMEPGAIERLKELSREYNG
jgi:hypothetical protein